MGAQISLRHLRCFAAVAETRSFTLAANRLSKIEGGFVVAAGGEVLAELALPVAGLMSLEPFEEVTVDIPSEYQGTVIERLSNRAFIMQHMITHENQVRLIFEGPTRGLLGYRGQFTIDTKGEGILCSHVLGFRPYAGEIKKRYVGSMTSMITGKAVACLTRR